MDSKRIRDLVDAQVGNRWNATNAHGVDLRKSVIVPRQIQVVERRGGRDQLISVWLVLIEDPDHKSGYRIVANREGTAFGLASEGNAADAHLVLDGWYGDFMTAFRSM